MSDLYNNMSPVPGSQPIAMVGTTVYNAQQDTSDYNVRNLPAGAKVEELAVPHQRELVFARKNQEPQPYTMGGNGQTHIRAIVEFTGSTHEEESEFQLLGYARNKDPPKGDTFVGPVLKQFAIGTGGTVTLFCNARKAIPVAARLMWAIPRSGPARPDPYGKNRLLAEIVEFKPENMIDNAAYTHSIVKKIISGNFDDLNLSCGERHKYQNYANAFSELSSICFTATIVAMQALSGSTVSDANKLELARLFGVGKSSGKTIKEMRINQSKANQFQEHLADAIFQMNTDVRTGNSHPTTALAAFPFIPSSSVSADTEEKNHIVRRQVSQYDNFLHTVISVYDNAQSRKLGFTPSGGVPGYDFDVIMSTLN